MRRSMILAACAAIVWGSVASADVVTLKNGDRVSGKIETLADGKLKMKADLMGDVTIELANVQTFSTDEPITLQFKDGTVVNQKITAAEAGKVSTQPGGTIQPQLLALADLSAVNPAPNRAVWTGHLTAGVTVTAGNSLSQSENMDASLERRSENDRLTVNGYYLYTETRNSGGGGDEVTANKWYAGLDYDYFVTKKWYIFANANYLRDQVANLEGRAVGGLGAGYQWVESKPMNFSTQLGVGAMHEAYTDPSRTDNTTIGQATYHFDKTLGPVTFLHDLTFLDDLSQESNFKVLTSAEMRAALYKALFASFKVIVDYDSNPAAGKERTDLEYILGVGVNF